MLTVARLLIVTALVLTGCRTAKRAAVSTFRVIDAPARYVRDRIEPEDGQTTTTTTTQTTVGGASDVARPGRPLPPPTVQSSATAPQRTITQSRPSATPRPTVPTTRTDTAATTQPSPTAPTTNFPTARQVPGKPGFVYSTDPKGGMIDVTGYKSGDKAKDPYTHEIFIVP
ncbi:MAG: hypothetical protein H0U43_04790 [Chthoniobacterales bacterium]|nr:hypothetical protein [Chthoniobacterales bacterium]